MADSVVAKDNLPCQLLDDLSKPPLESLWFLFRRPRAISERFRDN